MSTETGFVSFGHTDNTEARRPVSIETITETEHPVSAKTKNAVLTVSYIKHIKVGKLSPLVNPAIIKSLTAILCQNHSRCQPKPKLTAMHPTETDNNANKYT